MGERLIYFGEQLKLKLPTLTEAVSCAFVGTVAALSSPVEAQATMDQATGGSLAQSVIFVLVSVLITGMVTSWVNRATSKKTKEETNELILRNTKLLLELKESEVNHYKSKIDELSREIDVMKREVRSLKEENEHLLTIIGRKALEIDTHEKSR